MSVEDAAGSKTRGTGALSEADGGRWEGPAVKDGAIFKFEADPLTGEIRRSWPMSDGDL